MPLILSPNSDNFCSIWNNNFIELNSALANAEISSNGLLTLTKVDGSTFTNSIPYFPNFIISGIVASISDVPSNRTFSYTAGSYQINASLYSIALAGSFIVNTGHITLPRVDIVYLTNTNTVAYLPGTASANPVAPTLPANSLLLAYIGVGINATTSADLTLTTVNTDSPSNVSNGVLIDQTLRWNGASYVANSGLRANSVGKVSISGIAGFASMDSITKLQVGGAINIEDLGTPFPTTDKLYNNGGDLYWNGNIIGYTGTTIGSHLKWSGTTFIEQTDFLTSVIPNSAFNSSFISNDSIGLNSSVNLGLSSITGDRGHTLLISEPGNLVQSYVDLSIVPSGASTIILKSEDQNVTSETKISMSPTQFQMLNTDGSDTTELNITTQTIILNGGLVLKNRNTNISSGITAEDYTVIATAAPITLTLPALATNGQTFVFKSNGVATGGNPITIVGNTHNIDGAATAAITTSYGNITVQYNSALTKWLIISRF